MVRTRAIPRGLLLSRPWILVKRLELDLVLAEKVFVLPEPVQQFPFWKPSSPGAGLGRRNTLDLMSDAACAGEVAVALDLALLAEDAREDALRLWPGVAWPRFERRR